MNNNLTDKLNKCSMEVKNPLVAATLILTIGACYCVTVITNAKYNRDIDLTYNEFSLRIHAPMPDAAVVPV